MVSDNSSKRIDSGNDNAGSYRRLIPGDLATSFMAPAFFSVLSLSLMYLFDKLVKGSSTLFDIIAYMLMFLPTIAVILVIAYYRRPIAAAAGMALVNLVWYTLLYGLGGDSPNYMDIPGSIVAVIIDDILGGAAPAPIAVTLVVLGVFIVWSLLGLAIVSVTDRLLHRLSRLRS